MTIRTANGGQIKLFPANYNIKELNGEGMGMNSNNSNVVKIGVRYLLEMCIK